MLGFYHSYTLARPARPPGAADRVAAAAGPTDEPGLHPAAEPFRVRLVGEQHAGSAVAVARCYSAAAATARRPRLGLGYGIGDQRLARPSRTAFHTLRPWAS